MAASQIETDYLIVGAGLSGLCFADEMVRRSDARIVMVDARAAPGGHWNDAYPFVKLHQPSSFYGVESMELGDDRIDQDGFNKGFLSLASGPEITAYCHAVMRNRLLPSGRVTFLPMTAYEPDGTLRGLLSGRRTAVTVRRKLIDATYYTNSIPLTHQRDFTTAPQIACVPPNDLPRLATSYERFTILGGGKTGIDACLWLLENGVNPQRIRWVVPRDAWFVNRAKAQPGDAFFDDVFGAAADARDDIAAASSARDLAHRHERSGIWLRLDSAVEPSMFHAAHISEGELTELRRIDDIVRLGRVRSIVPDQVELQHGNVPAMSDTLYVDCTASALLPKPIVPVFQDGRIIIQPIRFPQLPFSAALIAFLEARFDDDEAKNAFAAPIPITITVDDYPRALKPDFENRLQIARDPKVRNWVRGSRLDGFARIAANVDPTSAERLNLLQRVKEATAAAYENLPTLLADAPDEARLRA